MPKFLVLKEPIMNYINNLYLTEYEYTDNCSLFNFEKKDDNYINLSSQKNFANIDLNKNLDNNFGSIMIPNTEKKTIETDLKKKFKNNLIFKINQMPYLEKDINDIIKIMNIFVE